MRAADPALISVLLLSNDLYHLLPQEDVLLIDSPVVVVMPEQPVVVILFSFDLLQKIGEGIWGKIRVQLLLDAGGCAVGDDVVCLIP